MDELDVVQRVLFFVHGEARRTKMRAVSHTWRAAHQHLDAGPRILVLVEWKIVICDEMAKPIQSVSITPPQIERALWDHAAHAVRLARCLASEPAYALKSLVTAGDLAIIAYRQGCIYEHEIDPTCGNRSFSKPA